QSANSEMIVAAIATSIAVNFKTVGEVENRVSITAETESPGGAGPTRSVNTPTICGRMFGSAKPLRNCLPDPSVSPTNVANVPASDDVISIRWHAGETTCARDTLATTTLRSVMSTRWVLTLTNSACSAACLPSLGAVPRIIPPFGGIARTIEQGTVTDIVTGVCEIRGAVTFESWPCCGQFNVAVVCTTGSSGVATDSTNPMRPATVATHRAIRMSCRTASARPSSAVAKIAVMAALESGRCESSR